MQGLQSGAGETARWCRRSSSGGRRMGGKGAVRRASLLHRGEEIHKYKYANTNTQTQIHKYKYTNTVIKDPATFVGFQKKKSETVSFQVHNKGIITSLITFDCSSSNGWMCVSAIAMIQLLLLCS